MIKIFVAVNLRWCYWWLCVDCYWGHFPLLTKRTLLQINLIVQFCLTLARGVDKGVVTIFPRDNGKEYNIKQVFMLWFELNSFNYGEHKMASGREGEENLICAELLMTHHPQCFTYSEGRGFFHSLHRRW